MRAGCVHHVGGVLPYRFWRRMSRTASGFLRTETPCCCASSSQRRASWLPSSWRRVPYVPADPPVRCRFSSHRARARARLRRSARASWHALQWVVQGRTRLLVLCHAPGCCLWALPWPQEAISRPGRPALVETLGVVSSSFTFYRLHVSQKIRLQNPPKLQVFVRDGHVLRRHAFEKKKYMFPISH